MLQQLALLAAGAQPWNHKICTAHSRRFAYAATLAIYVYVVSYITLILMKNIIFYSMMFSENFCSLRFYISSR